MKKENCLSKLVFICIFLTGAFSKPIMAKSDINELIDRLDLDKDGFITIRESVTEPRILAIFGTVDSNSDGKISNSELKKAKISTVLKPTTLESG